MMMSSSSSRKYVPKSRSDITGGKVESGQLFRLQKTTNKDYHHNNQVIDSNSALLNSFIRKRNEELDAEIKKYNLKLGFAEASEDNSQLLLRSQRHTSIKIESLKSDPKLNSEKDSTSQFFVEEKLNGHANDSVLIFLAKIRLKMEDLGVTGSALYEMLLPPEFSSSDTSISLREFIDVLQTDLLIPVTTANQKLISSRYGDGLGEISVQSFMADLGVEWEDYNRIKNDEPPKVDQPMPVASRGNSVNDDALARLNSLLTDNGVVSEAEKGSESSVLGMSSRHLTELNELHRWISEDEELASPEVSSTARSLSPTEFVVAPSSASNDLAPSSTGTRDVSKQLNTKGFAPVMSPVAEHAEEDTTETTPVKTKGTTTHGDGNREKLMLDALMEENKLLKKEISAFDMEFFEQLEDLKYRYVRMQEMVGGDPNHRNDDSSDVSASPKKLPLDRLAWSTKTSIRALDRAKYTSPLVSGPVASRLASNTHHAAAPTYQVNEYISASKPTVTQPKRGIVTNSEDDSFLSLCERRLAFELSTHRDPDEATRILIHRVMHVANRFGGGTHITGPQLSDAIVSVGLSMTKSEVEILCSGFASDGKGGIDAKEFCDMIIHLMYKIRNDSSQRAEEEEKRALHDSREHRINSLFIELCRSVLKNDKNFIRWTSKDLLRSVLQPFLEKDLHKEKILSMGSFYEVLTEDFGTHLSLEDIITLVEPNTLRKQKSLHSSDVVSAFRSSQLTGSLRGSAAVDGTFRNWLDHNGVHPGEDRVGLSDNLFVDYPRFVVTFVDNLEQVIDAMGGISIPEKPMPWILKEFWLLNFMLSHLEALDSRERRRQLMTLQYALSTADPKETGELDGFTLLNVLINCGFQLQRINRTQLLRVAEEMGGKIGYLDLFRVLLNSAADWTQEEKALVHKILKAMGVIVYQRRAWLAKLRVTLMGYSNRKKEALESMESSREDTEMSAGIPPATFLHCLRDCGVNLTVDEEAILLDCLDTEQLALRMAKAHSSKNKNFSLFGVNGTMSISLINYESFVNFCARHCGEWYDAYPDVDAAIRTAVGTARNPVSGVQEFIVLMKSFDESGDGKISKRTFQICLHRSRLFSEFSEKVINDICDTLSVEGGGKVEYMKFGVYLRTVCPSLGSSKTSSAEHISMELLKNASDSSKTLRPLRDWLGQNTDVDSPILTTRDIQSLLVDFQVIYSTADLESLLAKFGKSVTDFHRLSESSSLGNVVIDARELIAHLLKIRPHWTELHSTLRKRLKSAFANAANALSEKSPHSSSRKSERSLIMHIISRLKAFYNHSIDGQEDVVMMNTPAMIDRDIFALVCRNADIQISDEDVWKLADATDCQVAADRISCDILLDLLLDEGVSSLQLTDAGYFAIDHIRDMLWRTASRLDRDFLEWSTDVRTLFRGFDPRRTGFISVEDFQSALKILNASVADASLLDISAGSQYILFEEVLTLVLTPPSKKVVSNEQKDEKAQQTVKFSIQPKKMDKDSSVYKVLHLTRKRLHKFIISDDTLEEAWITLLKVFQRFDPLDSSKVSPRDFCIAVSALMDDDEAVLSPTEWSEIVHYFRTKSDLKSSEPPMVDYMIFCEAVLDPADVQKMPPRHSDDASAHHQQQQHGQKYLTKSSMNRGSIAGNSAQSFDGFIAGRSMKSRTSQSAIGGRNQLSESSTRRNPYADGPTTVSERTYNHRNQPEKLSPSKAKAKTATTARPKWSTENLSYKSTSRKS